MKYEIDKITDFEFLVTVSIKCRYENFTGAPLKECLDNFIESDWPIYEFENSAEVLQWLAKKD